ncbi:hypothetical protein PPSIR1_20799 [Plesiocystis pacifica SIR-1]|uniref:Uncharacterized protein n=1 Tax=Plesiocystis pacifica SIR-1 TaxID=391625 RepID=A6GGS5_9BACT|nr:hypothetical protein PPSIR1_20799 [Plesiocystis pacifica SIR-1]
MEPCRLREMVIAAWTKREATAISGLSLITRQ